MSKQLVATTPAEMEVTQKDLSQAFYRKWKEWEALAEETANVIATAKNAGMAHQALTATLRKQRKQCVYYEKLHAAVDAGYHVIPSMPCEVFAIRTDAKQPKAEWSGQSYEQFEQRAKQLPVGEGEYLAPLPTKMAYEALKDNKDGSQTEVTRYKPVAFKPQLSLPSAVERQELIMPIQHAIGLKIFDDVAVAPPRGGDPVLLGRIQRPGRPWQSGPWGGDSYICFILAWFVNPDTDF